MPRLRKHYDKDYTVIPNNVIRDTRLSYKARGIFLYLWHLPQDYDISLADIQRHSEHDGQLAVRTGVRELETCGYLHFARIRMQGKFVDTEWTMNDRPSLENSKTVTLTLESQNTLKYLEGESTKKEESTKKKPGTSACAEPLIVECIPQHVVQEKPQTLSPPPRRMKTLYPTDPAAQDCLRATILDEGFHVWFAQQHLTLNLDDQWDAFARKALANGYRYMDWRAAFMNWLKSDYQQPLNGRRAPLQLSETKLAEIREAIANAR